MICKKTSRFRKKKTFWDVIHQGSTVALPSTATQTPSSISSDFAPSTPTRSSDFAPPLSSAPASETTALVTKGGVSTGAIAGIVVGVVLLLLIIALTASFCDKRLGRQNQPAPPTLPFLIQRPTDMPVTQPLARAPTSALTRSESSDGSTSAWKSSGIQDKVQMEDR